jgi:hypothetical protein
MSQLRDQETHGQKLYIEVNNLQNRIFDTGLWDIFLKNGPAYTDSLLRANPNLFKIHTENKELLFEYYNALNFWQVGIGWRFRSCIYLQKKAVNLINLIQKQFPLEKE